MQSAGRLTQRTIAALKPRPGERYVVWDSEVTGFGVRVAAQARTFILKYRSPSGRVRWMSFGRVGAIALERARKRARSAVGVVADGRDPQTQSDAARDAWTLGDVAGRFLKEHVEARRSASTLRLYKLVIDGHLRPRFGAVPITEIGTAHALKLQYRLRATPYLANRATAVFSVLMNWAARAGYRGSGPHVNPTDGLEKFTEQPRKRYLTPEELRRLGAALRGMERYGSVSPAAVAAIRLLLFTGCRTGEILALKWADVDLKAGVMQLAKTKTGPRVLLLNAPAREVLQRWPRFAGSPFVFPGQGRGTRNGEHLEGLKKVWARICRRARIHGVRLHDLRHSFASVAVSGGLALPIVGGLLGHSQAQTTQRYAHLMDDPLRAASDATAGAIATAMSRRRR